MQLLKSENKKTNILPLLAVATFGLNIITLLVLMFHGTILQQLNRKNTTPSLAQLADGSAITVDPKQNIERHPETIRRFVGETMTLLFTWSQKQPPKNVWLIGSQLLANGFRQKFETEIYNLGPEYQSGNISRGTEGLLLLQRVSRPEQIGKGKWKVEVLANYLTLTSYDSIGKSTPLNKQILVRVVDDIPTSPPNGQLPLQLAVHRLGEAKLEIYNICDITEKNCS